MKHFFLRRSFTHMTLSLIILLTFSLFGSATAFADATPSINATISGAAKTVTGTFTGLGTNEITALDDTNQNNKLLGTLTVNPTDATGTGDGWIVTATAGALTNTNGKTLTPKISNNSTYSSNVVLPTKVDPSSSAVTSEMIPTTFDTALSSDTPLTLETAHANAGMGSYTFTDAILVDVPANTYAGTYSTTITLDIAPLPTGG